MKKALLILVALVVMTFAVVACADEATPEATPAPAPEAPAGETQAEEPPPALDPDEQITISFWDGNWQESVFPAVAEIWATEFPNITVQAEFQPDLANDRYMLALMSGTAPDVLASALDWVTTFGHAGLLANLNPHIDASGLNLGDFVQGAIQAATVNGNVYGLPFRSETFVLFYNRDLLAEAGWDSAPTTWDEVLEVAAAVQAGGTSGYGLVGTNFGNFSFQYITMLRLHGGNVFNADYTAAALNTPEAIATNQLYRDLAQFAPTSLLENDNIANRTLFATGSVAMYAGGIFDLEEIVNVNPDLNFGTALMPTGNNAERHTILGGWSVAMAGHSTEQAAAWEFINFLVRPDVAALYTNTFTGTGVIADRYRDFPAELIDPAREGLQFATALPNVPNITGIREAMFNNLQLMLTDDMSAEEAAQRLDDIVNELLAQN